MVNLLQNKDITNELKNQKKKGCLGVCKIQSIRCFKKKKHTRYINC